MFLDKPGRKLGAPRPYREHPVRRDEQRHLQSEWRMGFGGSISSLFRKPPRPNRLAEALHWVGVRASQILSTDSCDAGFFQLQGDLSLWVMCSEAAHARHF